MTRPIGLNFHGVGRPARELEPGEAPYWVQVDQFVHILDRVVASADPTRYIITFDDGNLSDYEIALPALLDRGLTARFFVLTGRLEMEGALAPHHLREMQTAGMTIGSHGIAHVAWTDIATDALDQEITHSKKTLEETLGTPVVEAGIPFGRYDARVLRALRHAGFQTAWSSDGGTLNPTAYVRARTSLRGDMSEAEFDAVLAGHLGLKRQLRRTLGMAKRTYLPLG